MDNILIVCFVQFCLLFSLMHQKILSLYLWVASSSLDARIVLPLDAGDVADEEVGADAAHVWDQQAARGKIEGKGRVKLIFGCKSDLCQTSYLA